MDPSTGSSTNHKRTTTMSNKNAACQNIHEAASRISDCGTILGDALATLKNDESTKKAIGEALLMLSKSVKPALDVASEKMLEGAVFVNPGNSGTYVHRRDESARKRELDLQARLNPSSSRKRKTSNRTLDLLNVYVENNSEVPTVTPPQKRNTPCRRANEERFILNPQSLRIQIRTVLANFLTYCASHIPKENMESILVRSSSG